MLIYEGSGVTGTLMDVITEATQRRPGGALIGRESYVSIESRIDLCAASAGFLAAYSDGKSYCEILQMLDRHVKKVSITLQRVKQQARKLMAERGN